MKKYLASLAVLLCTPVVATAAPPSDKSIEQMMSVMQVEKMLNQMLAQMDTGMRAGMEQGLRQSLHDGIPTSGQKAKMDEFQTKFTAILKDELSYAKMRDIYLQTYRETFTQDEVNSIIMFYSTPAGKAMVEKVPIAMQKAATLTQARLGPFIQELQTMAEQFGKDLETKK